VLFGEPAPVASRAEVVERLIPYVEAQRSLGVPVPAITRHILGLYQAVPGARLWRRTLSENVHRPGTGPEVIQEALAWVEWGHATPPVADARLVA